MHWRTLLSVGVLFGVIPFGAIETQAGNPRLDGVRGSESCGHWIEYQRRAAFAEQTPIAVMGVRRCSPARLQVACRLAETGAPVRGLTLCPTELCPSIGRALIGLGLAAMPRDQLSMVYRLCPSQW
jgi:hypothetical protein